MIITIDRNASGTRPFCCRKPSFFTNMIYAIGIIDMLWNIYLCWDALSSPQTSADFIVIYCLLSLIFVMFLFNGIEKQKPNLLLPFFIKQVFCVIFCLFLLIAALIAYHHPPSVLQSLDALLKFEILMGLACLIYEFTAIIIFISYIHFRYHSQPSSLPLYREMPSFQIGPIPQKHFAFEPITI